MRYVTSAAVVDTRPDVVRRRVQAFEQYPSYFPAYQDATVTSSTGSETDVQFYLSLNMAIIEPDVSYTLTFRSEPNGDITFRRKAGDFSTRRGRWEFIPLGKNRTLLAFTGWINYGGLGWSVDTVLWAQPELERALPVTRAAAFVDTVRRKAETGTISRMGETEPLTVPTIPAVLQNEKHHASLESLTGTGTPMFIHPDQYLADDGDSINLIFSSTVDLVKGPPSRAKKLLTNFEKVPDFIRQLESVQANRTDTGFRANWTFNLGFGVASIPVGYRVEYKWESERRLTFRRLSGDFKHIYGAYEWASVDDNKTLYAFSSASHIGEDAPSLVKLGNLIPNRQIFMGVTLGAIGVENGVKWANEQLGAAPGQ
ncbi:MAG: SRPBCC family protein [bacterium]